MVLPSHILAQLHDGHHVAHRDVKPSNVLLRQPFLKQHGKVRFFVTAFGQCHVQPWKCKGQHQPLRAKTAAQLAAALHMPLLHCCACPSLQNTLLLLLLLLLYTS
jgi:serine/threonine protein kinase